MNKYIYDGPVVIFGSCVMNHFKAETMAASEAKARSNLAYQYKKKYNQTASSNIELPGEIKKIG